MPSKSRQRQQLDSPWKEALEQFLDWMLSLPRELEHSFRDEPGRFEEERRMPYVTTNERLARQEGLAEGRQEGLAEGRQEGLAEGLQAGILALLETRLQRVGAKYKRQIRSLRDVERLEALLRAATQAKALDDVFLLLR